MDVQLLEPIYYIAEIVSVVAVDKVLLETQLPEGWKVPGS